MNKKKDDGILVVRTYYPNYFLGVFISITAGIVTFVLISLFSYPVKTHGSDFAGFSLTVQAPPPGTASAAGEKKTHDCTSVTDKKMTAKSAGKAKPCSAAEAEKKVLQAPPAPTGLRIVREPTKKGVGR